MVIQINLGWMDLGLDGYWMDFFVVSIIGLVG